MILDSIFQFGFIQKKHTFMALHNAHQGAADGSKYEVQFQSAVLKFSKMLIEMHIVSSFSVCWLDLVNDAL